MPKVIIPLGLDPDLFLEIESRRGDTRRTKWINEKLREIVMPASVPRQTGTTATPQQKTRDAA